MIEYEIDGTGTSEGAENKSRPAISEYDRETVSKENTTQKSKLVISNVYEQQALLNNIGRLGLQQTRIVCEESRYELRVSDIILSCYIGLVLED